VPVRWRREPQAVARRIVEGAHAEGVTVGRRLRCVEAGSSAPKGLDEHGGWFWREISLSRVPLPG